MSLVLTRGESLALIVHSSSGRFFVAREYLMIASSIPMLNRPFSSDVSTANARRLSAVILNRDIGFRLPGGGFPVEAPFNVVFVSLEAACPTLFYGMEFFSDFL